MKLGEKISYFRKRSNITQEQLAEVINVSRQTIYKWENNVAIPRADHIIALVKCLNISYKLTSCINCKII